MSTPDPHPDWFAAIKGGDLEAVDRMLAARPALASARHETGLSSLMWACYCRRPDVVARLLETGLEPDLFEAVAAGDEAAAAALLGRDPSLSLAWSADGFTALHLAAFFSRPLIAARLVELCADAGAVARNPSRVQPLHSAAAAGDVAIARLLLERGANAGARQAGGYTPLMAAAQLGSDALASLLLEHGADGGDRADDGRAAADFADGAGHHALAARLRAPSSGA